MRATETPGSMNGSVYPDRAAFPLKAHETNGVKPLKDKQRFSLAKYSEDGGIRIW